MNESKYVLTFTKNEKKNEQTPMHSIKMAVHVYVENTCSWLVRILLTAVWWLINTNCWTFLLPLFIFSFSSLWKYFRPLFWQQLLFQVLKFISDSSTVNLLFIKASFCRNYSIPSRKMTQLKFLINTSQSFNPDRSTAMMF